MAIIDVMAIRAIRAVMPLSIIAIIVPYLYILDFCYDFNALKDFQVFRL